MLTDHIELPPFGHSPIFTRRRLDGRAELWQMSPGYTSIPNHLIAVFGSIGEALHARDEMQKRINVVRALTSC